MSESPGGAVGDRIPRCTSSVGQGATHWDYRHAILSSLPFLENLPLNRYIALFRRAGSFLFAVRADWYIDVSVSIIRPS